MCSSQEIDNRDRLTGNIVPKDDIKQSHHARRAPLFHEMSDYSLTGRSSWKYDKRTNSSKARSKIDQEKYVRSSSLCTLTYARTRARKLKNEFI